MVNNPIDPGVANIQYIKNKCIQSGEKYPRGNVVIVKIIDNNSDSVITIKATH